MADIKRFLDNAGVSTLWGQVANEINNKVNAEKTRAMTAEEALQAAITAEANRAKAAEEANATAASNAQTKANSAMTQANTNKDAIAVLNGTGTGSVAATVAAEIAKIVAGADTSLDTLKEIADWITTHGGDASVMNTKISSNATAISALQGLVGSTKVADQISAAIDAQDLSKYALASSLTSLQQTYNTFAGKGVRPITQEEINKLAKLNLENGNLTISGSVAAGSVTGLQAYVDDRIDALVVPMTATEVIEACKIEA